MKIIYNNIIPFKGFIAINLFGVLFVRKLYKDIMQLSRYQTSLINHESIHTAQMKELWYVGFYIIYLLEWVRNLFFSKYAMSHNAYRHISFEEEAYDNEKNLDYLSTREKYAQWK